MTRKQGKATALYISLECPCGGQGVNSQGAYNYAPGDAFDVRCDTCNALLKVPKFGRMG